MDVWFGLLLFAFFVACGAFIQQYRSIPHRCDSCGLYIDKQVGQLKYIEYDTWYNALLQRYHWYHYDCYKQLNKGV